MSNDQPPPAGPGGDGHDGPPENDPFRKPPPGPGGGAEPPPPPPGGPPPGGPPPGQAPPPPPQGPPPGSPYGPGQGGGPYGGSGPYGGAGGTPPPPYGGGPYGGGPYGGTPDPLAGMPPLADFGRRLAARVIDALIVFIPLFLISLLAGGWDTSGGGDDWDDITSDLNTGRQWLWSLISLVAYVAYDTLMVKRNGQTVGKRLLRLRVAMLNDGSTPNTGAALTRAAVLWAPALICCFCVWWLVIIITIVADKPYRQGLHDKAAKTVVVTVPEGTTPGQGAGPGGAT
ncbi:RDD family protein [Streptomyces sp. NPDC020875]|uniref:RDD family protein n=1 Tax=Streptomyces sp. NPDC020875 TaxID=3154898 RepID=UPI0033C66DEC